MANKFVFLDFYVAALGHLWFYDTLHAADT